MRIIIAIALAAALISPASAKVYVLKFGDRYEIWDTRGLYDYPIVSVKVGPLSVPEEKKLIRRLLRDARPAPQ